MAKRRKATFRSKARGRAPWRETRVVDSQLFGNTCVSGLDAACDRTINGGHFVFPAIGLPCATILAYPLVNTFDFQSQTSGTTPAWKERVVHTHTDLKVVVQPHYLWLAQVSRQYFAGIQTGQTSAVLIAPWRAAMFVYDDDEVLLGQDLTSLWTEGWMESERYIPGTFREGRIYHQSSVVEWKPETISVKTSAKRRLETGTGLYWVFEMGCVTALQSDGTDIADSMYAAYGGPFWLLGQFRSTYVE